MKWMDVKGYTSLEGYLDADRVGCEMKWPKKENQTSVMGTENIYRG